MPLFVVIKILFTNINKKKRPFVETRGLILMRKLLLYQKTV